MNDRPIEQILLDDLRGLRECGGHQAIKFSVPELNILITALERATVPEPVKKAIHDGLDRFQGLDPDTLEQHGRIRGNQTILKEGEIDG